ncbi:hypothetical protein [Desulfonema ishimotonii]|uniref:hypothetical protein n=1 Tax=Desulfonema ishimotonii TaxID=45657 RepID=UPI000F55FB49|nr:hypothetical protein [Desulfonema ishimotonii]
MGQLRTVALREARYFMKEYRDVIQEAPFQFQADMLFVVRAIGMLSGMAAALDPDFDVWAKTLPYARQYAKEALEEGWPEWLQIAFNPLQSAFRLPGRMEQTLNQARRGKLVVRVSLAPDTRKCLNRLNRSVNRLSLMLLGTGFILASAILYTGRPDETGWTVPAVLAALVFIRAMGNSGE